MRQLHRPALPANVQDYLQKKQAEVDGHPSPSAEAKRVWPGARDTIAFQSIQDHLKRMNGDEHHCMYCDHNEARHIDHFHPKSRYPERAFRWDNYFLACDVCNGTKLDQFPLDPQGKPLLVNSAEEDPHPELPYSLSTGKYDELAATNRGKACIQTFELNRPHLERARQRAWRAVQRTLDDFVSREAEGDIPAVEAALSDLCAPPKLALLQELLYLHSLKSKAVPERCLPALERILLRPDVSRFFPRV